MSYQSYIDFTVPMTEAIALRSIPKTVTYKYLTRDSFHSVTSFSLSPHSLTHIDLPWSLNWEEIRRKNDDELKPFIRDFDRLDTFSKPLKSIRCKGILVDIRYKRDLAEQSGFIESIQRDQVISPSIEPGKFCDLLLRLCIRKKELEEVVDQIDDPSKTLLLFQTGWDAFLPDHRNLDHPIWECWHLFLTHPYLDQKAAAFLAEKGFLGIGADTPCLDSPMYYVDENDCLPYVRTAKRLIGDLAHELLREELRFPWYKPVHTILLSRNRMLLENLRIRYKNDLSEMLRTATSPTVTPGDLEVHPIDPGSYVHDAVLVKVLFSPRAKQ